MHLPLKNDGHTAYSQLAVAKQWPEGANRSFYLKKLIKEAFHANIDQ